jgi:hypothetical protein
MRKIMKVFVLLALILFSSSLYKDTIAQSLPAISNISIDPNLDISLFSAYEITANISDYSIDAPVSVDISGINGDGGSIWNYYADGTAASETLVFTMDYVSGTEWKKTGIYPDYIYPEIFFAPSSITWNNSPENTVIRRNQYHLLHLQNPFSMTDEMSFWIEIDAVAKAANSADLQVYLVKKGKNLDFFNSDWRNSSDIELVGTISRGASFHHTHTANSSHHLISLATNSDGTIGGNNLDISGDFWIILYNTSPNNNRGWDLRYHGTSLCNNNSSWYIGNQTGWATTHIEGCPDMHIHIARRNLQKLDGVRAVITAGDVSETKEFYFAELPNLAPNATRFTNPLGGTYSDNISINWEEASDANNDVLTYNIYLLDSENNVLETLVSGTSSTSYSFDSTTRDNGSYRLKGEACDNSLCTEFLSETNFIIDNSDPIYTISRISMSSNNTDSTKAHSGDTVTINYAATGRINTPSIHLYSGGNQVNNTVTTKELDGNNWTSSYVVSSSDAVGYVTFEIGATNLGAEYFETTDGSYVLVEEEVAANIVEATSDSLSEPVNPSCKSDKPVGIPDLFEIRVNGRSATLFITPINNINSYYISYSENENAFQHGVSVDNIDSSGVFRYRVNLLELGKRYYFKVRGQNGCMPGEWGENLEVKIPFTRTYKEQKYYRVKPVNLNSLDSIFTINEKTTYRQKPKIVNKTKGLDKEKSNTTEEKTKKEKNKEFCFLWWCF